MNKTEFVKRIAARLSISQKEAQTFINAYENILLTLLTLYQLVTNSHNRVASDVSIFLHLLPEEGWGCLATTEGDETTDSRLCFFCPVRTR